MNVIISGRKQVGKSTISMNIYKKLARNNSVGGVITLGNKTRMFLLLPSEREVPFEAKDNRAGIAIGRFNISKKSLMAAKLSIMNSRNLDFTIIDELGLLEKKQQGFYPEFTTIIQKKAIGCLLVVREDATDFFIREYPKLKSYHFYEVKERRSSFHTQKILKLLTK